MKDEEENDIEGTLEYLLESMRNSEEKTFSIQEFLNHTLENLLECSDIERVDDKLKVLLIARNSNYKSIDAEQLEDSELSNLFLQDLIIIIMQEAKKFDHEFRGDDSMTSNPYLELMLHIK